MKNEIRCRFRKVVGYCRDVNCCYYMDNGGCSDVSKKDTANKILMAHMKLEELKRLRLENDSLVKLQSKQHKSPVKQVNNR